MHNYVKKYSDKQKHLSQCYDYVTNKLDICSLVFWHFDAKKRCKIQ